MQQASGFKKLQNKLGISKASLGSLYESVRIFAPERFKEIAKELGDPLPRIKHRRISQGDQTAILHRLSSLGRNITAVDGSIVHVLARIAKGAWIKIENRGWISHMWLSFAHTVRNPQRGPPAN